MCNALDEREGVRNDRHILCSDWLRGKSVVSLASLYAWCFSLYKSSVSQSLHQSPPALSPLHTLLLLFVVVVVTVVVVTVVVAVVLPSRAHHSPSHLRSCRLLNLFVCISKCPTRSAPFATRPPTHWKVLRPEARLGTSFASSAQSARSRSMSRRSRRTTVACSVVDV
jgi:hypothetical protein